VGREVPKKEEEQAPADDPSAGVWRRRLLYSCGGILLLASGGVKLTGGGSRPASALSAGNSRSNGTSGLPADGLPGGMAQPSTPAAGPTPVQPRPTSPQARLVSAPQYYVEDAGPMAIALTLDDGPHPVYTPQVLMILERYGIRATFNMIGEQIGDNLSLVREVAAAGHTITNHTWDHADLRTYSANQVASEIDRCNDALAEAGQQPSIFRAPYGYWTPAVFEACADRGLNPLGWSVDPQDWDTEHVSTWDIVNKVLRTTKQHDIILEHDGGGDRSNTVAAMQIFIPELLGRGFVFAAV